MGSGNSTYWEGVADYLSRNNRNQNETQLLQENRELRIAFENLHNEYLQIKSNQEECKKLIETLIGGNYPRVSHPNGLMTRGYRMLKFKSILFSQNGISGNDASSLTLNQKRLINLNLLAFGELLSLNEIVLNYVNTNLTKSAENMITESEILAEALTKDNSLELHAIQAWGYLQMAIAANRTNSDYIKYGLSVINNEDKANEWLKYRITQLINNAQFNTDSPMPIQESIPNPLEMWEIEQLKEIDEFKAISESLSGNRDTYIFDINNPKGYPKRPKGVEFLKGPVYFNFDNALIWGAKLITTNSELSMDELVSQTLKGERLPTLLNKGRNERFEVPASTESESVSLLDVYGIKK